MWVREKREIELESTRLYLPQRSAGRKARVTSSVPPHWALGGDHSWLQFNHRAFLETDVIELLCRALGHGAGCGDLDCGGRGVSQAVGLAGVKGRELNNWPIAVKEGKWGAGGGRRRGLWVSGRAGAIHASGNSNADLHQMGSFSPSVQVSVSRWENQRRKQRSYLPSAKESVGRSPGLWAPPQWVLCGQGDDRDLKQLSQDPRLVRRR